MFVMVRLLSQQQCSFFPKALRRVRRQKASALHTPRHLHRSPTLRNSTCTHRTTCTAHIHYATALTSLTYRMLLHTPLHLHHSPTPCNNICLHTPLHLHRSPTPRHSICTHRPHIAFYFLFFASASPQLLARVSIPV